MSFKVGDLVVRCRDSQIWENRVTNDPHGPQVVLKVSKELTNGLINIQVEALPSVWWNAKNFLPCTNKDTNLEDFL
jgi:hypothetical protein